MVADGRQHSVGALGQAGGLGGQVQEGVHHRRTNLGLDKSDVCLPVRPPIIKEVSDSTIKKKIDFVEGKAKEILNISACSTPRILKANVESHQKSNKFEASSSDMKIYVNNFGYSNAIPDLRPRIKANFLNEINNNLPSNDKRIFGD
ncbi:hypothetical protein MA16_Dca013186 [Dendrobium catenatum]|uniref:Uncharacterized protein n=1 Tax=Dendrobium catenatum TaxID=906689 RepID=A0A2I0WR32_9ASPA|nr:hypothetical protein MA16_Dca013186 [Dendrobium catenatum]